MDEIRFVDLAEIEDDKIISLMNEERVGRQLPLLSNGFSSDDLQAFLADKKRLWDEHGFGPWAILIKGKFAGWGGLQPEQGDADFALVLAPDYWGWGKAVFDKVKDQAFRQMGLESITILLPPSRPNLNAIRRFGFVEEGQLTLEGKIFKRFRLHKSPS